MHPSIIALALGAFGTASASHRHYHGILHELPEGTWMAPRDGDVRSPCPMLNVLANHGYLPRDGKNISQNITRSAMKGGLNLEPDFADIMFGPALLTNPRPNQTTFDLDHLNRHNILEHDGSLSRADAYWDDSQVFNETVYEETLTYFQNDTVDLKAAAAARMGRVISSTRTNPTFFLNATSEMISLGETAAYILALGDRETGTVPLNRVRMMFEQEKLPVELGWSTGQVPATANDLFDLTQRIIDSTDFPTLRARMNGGIHAGIVAKRFL
ncbi:Peroxidase, family 2-domain-containing protein [Dactylonectria estremocensis]|uniref:Peroxidase, family 2-domain-containing protein n=1 Tax=Dactylonectria estremocensis TaxID=1079267 RepID=A0A9P9EQ34_9HYPO|nr:Peroxidase, family 2-domain-containing protein [Dactylonectria estremocensis]